MNHFASDDRPADGERANDTGVGGAGGEAHHARTFELLAGRALDELSTEESIELDALLIQFPELDDEGFELAAASLLVAGVGSGVADGGMAGDDHATVHAPQDAVRSGAAALPAALRERVEASSRRWLDAHARPERGGVAFARATRATTSAEAHARRPDAVAPPRRGSLSDSSPDRSEPSSDLRASSGSVLARLGWPLAIAASVVAAVAWWPHEVVSSRSGSSGGIVGGDSAGGSGGGLTDPVDLAAAMAALREVPGTITVPWTGGGHARCAEPPKGEVVWNGAKQEGFMRIGGLAANDPKALQYQLWIFDAERDDRYPVDGGVFDMPASNGEVIVPIRAALGVSRPALFAVTVEPPGGVVVSARDVVLAATPR